MEFLVLLSAAIGGTAIGLALVGAIALARGGKRL